MKNWTDLTATIFITAFVAAMMGGDVVMALDENGDLMFGVTR